MEERKDGFRALRLLYGAVQFFYWAGGSVALGFAVAFLRELGFDNAQAGLVSAFASLLGGVLMLVVSRRIDRSGAGSVYGWSWLLVLAQCLALGGILLLRKRAFAAALCYTLYLALTLTLSSTVSKLYIDLKRGGVPIRFGVARGFGSLGYALTSLSAGFLLARFHPFVLLPAGQGLFLLMSLLLLPLRLAAPEEAPAERESAEAAPPAPLGNFLRGSRLFLLLVLGISLVSAANKTLTAFLVNVVRGVGGNTEDFGAVSGYLALIEVPATFLFVWLKKRWRLSALLVASMCFYTLKIAGYAFAGSVSVLLLASSLHAFSTGIFQPASVEYVRQIIPHEHTGLAQAMMLGGPMLFSFATTVGFGRLLDSSSVSVTLRLLLLIAALGTALCFFCVRRLRPLQQEKIG